MRGRWRSAAYAGGLLDTMTHSPIGPVDPFNRLLTEQPCILSTNIIMTERGPRLTVTIRTTSGETTVFLDAQALNGWRSQLRKDAQRLGQAGDGSAAFIKQETRTGGDAGLLSGGSGTGDISCTAASPLGASAERTVSRRAIRRTPPAGRGERG